MPNIDYEHIGALTIKMEHPPAGVDANFWQLGYSHCLSDLIAMIWPGKAGGQRVSQLRERHNHDG